MAASDDVLSDEDRRFLEHIDGEIESADDPEEFRRVADELRDAFREHLVEFRQFQERTERRLNQLERTPSDGVNEDAPPIERYATIPPEERTELLDTSEQIAVAMHCNWEDVAWTLGGGSNYADTSAEKKMGVDTKARANAKYNPSRLKHRLKTLLEEDLQSNQVYRGLKRLAKLSGGEEVVDQETGRVHVIGGRYEYREMTTADNQDTKRVLWEADE